VGQDGKPADDSYYFEWERRASAFAWSGSHLLLFSPGYIEVRDIDTGGLVCLEELHNLDLLCSGWAEWPRLVGSITNKENDGGQSQRLVELVRSGN
jgi:CNH domain